MRRLCSILAASLAAAAVSGTPLSAQQSTIPANQLDPARNPSELKSLARDLPLREQYIWTEVDRAPASRAPKADSRRWEFRRVFSPAAARRQVTLYVAASGDVQIWPNGQRLLAYSDNRTLRPGFTVHALDVESALHAGSNAVAICVTHLHGAHHTTTDLEPELAGMPWIDGAVPTPHGSIRVRAESRKTVLDLPDHVDATVLLKASEKSEIYANGVPVATQAAPSIGYRSVQIDGAGHYEIVFP